MSSPLVEVADLRINTTTKTVHRAGRAVDLTPREYSLLLYLALRSGQVVTRTEIWNNVYEFTSDVHSNVVDVYIGHLRKKLDQCQFPSLIHTRRGYGYILEAPK
jgi:DNA-binding response OmpR family regulator